MANKDKPDNKNRPRSNRSKGKASHSDQIKSYNKGRRTARTHNDNILPSDTQSDRGIQDEDILIGAEDMVLADREEP